MQALTLAPVVFGYNFPHKKTQDFLQRLFVSQVKPSMVVLADPVPLNLPASPLRTKPRHCDLIHPRTLCESLGFPYRVLPHGGESCAELLRSLRPRLGVVAGGRILPRRILDCFSCGIINFHPGLIPEVRGLDALQWALYLDLPLGVTAHLIDHRVDAGWIIQRTVIEEFPDDTLIDLSLRLYETQVQMLAPVLEMANTSDRESFQPVIGGEYRRSFPAELAAVLPRKLEGRMSRKRRAA